MCAFFRGGRANDKLELGISLPNWVMRPFIVTVRIHGQLGNARPGGLIGLGVMFDPEKYVRVENDKGEHRVLVGYYRDKPFIYQIKGLWLKGERFPTTVSPHDWFKRLE